MTKVEENQKVEPFVISRVFEAPRELVFKAYTDPEHLMHWWGPKGFKMSTAKLDLRPGGIFHYSIQIPDGGTMWGRFIYREISAPERIVYVNAFSDAEGGITRHPMAPTWPLEMLNDMTLEDLDGKRTKLTSTSTPFNASEEEIATFEKGRPSLTEGVKGSFEQLDAYLASIQTH